MTRAGRVRLDTALVERGLVPTRSVARGMIMAGMVTVDGARVDKAGAPVTRDSAISLKSGPRFVSRAGEKLAHALAFFDLDVQGARALDVGASTGGFVDCLLQAGAAEVIALDVGYGQLDQRLRGDPHVHVLERVNARYLSSDGLPYVPDLLTVDVSFISLRTILPAVIACMSPAFSGLLLVKPQFEAGPELVGKGGIVRSTQVRHDVLEGVAAFLGGPAGLEVRGVTDSGLPGAGGNVEFFFWVERAGGEAMAPDTLAESIDRVSAVVAASAASEAAKAGRGDEHA
jgi:23S rRNA (cytidine1920-2'-O)/16S rRNA (cytidine1409-2'-O)-methyltransferase